jgi:hypothetical protein
MDNYGTSQFQMDESSINGAFTIAALNDQRLCPHKAQPTHGIMAKS